MTDNSQVKRYLEIEPLNNDYVLTVDLGTSVPPLSGKLDLTALFELTGFRASNTHISSFTGASRTKIVSLELSGNSMMNIAFSSLELLSTPTLKKLNTYQTPISGYLTSFDTLSTIQYINCGSNKLKKTIQICNNKT